MNVPIFRIGVLVLLIWFLIVDYHVGKISHQSLLILVLLGCFSLLDNLRSHWYFRYRMRKEYPDKSLKGEFYG